MIFPTHIRKTFSILSFRHQSDSYSSSESVTSESSSESSSLTSAFSGGLLFSPSSTGGSDDDGDGDDGESTNTGASADADDDGGCDSGINGETDRDDGADVEPDRDDGADGEPDRDDGADGEPGTVVDAVTPVPSFPGPGPLNNSLGNSSGSGNGPKSCSDKSSFDGTDGEPDRGDGDRSGTFGGAAGEGDPDGCNEEPGDAATAAATAAAAAAGEPDN